MDTQYTCVKTNTACSLQEYPVSWVVVLISTGIGPCCMELPEPSVKGGKHAEMRGAFTQHNHYDLAAILKIITTINQLFKLVPR